ncbi:hypothetical protein RintRC_7764 [Richelia intracellularis]|nr:hypothetical protein RintRC_7764 [Richelia intracellularis]
MSGYCVSLFTSSVALGTDDKRFFVAGILSDNDPIPNAPKLLSAYTSPFQLWLHPNQSL